MDSPNGNTYRGTTTINNGTLLVNNLTGYAMGDGAVIVNGGVTTHGILGGSGFISGPVTVNSGGTLAPGASAGTITINNSLNLKQGSFLKLQLGGAGAGEFDRVSGLTALILDGTIDVSLINGFDPTVGQSFDLIDWTLSLNAVGFNVNSDLHLPGLDPGLAWDRSSFLTDGSIAVAQVPEASDGVLILALLFGGCAAKSWQACARNRGIIGPL